VAGAAELRISFEPATSGRGAPARRKGIRPGGP
jgi:hypothetical protein